MPSSQCAPPGCSRAIRRFSIDSPSDSLPHVAEFWYLTEQVTGVDAAVLRSASREDLADSAVHAPRVGFGDDDFYPDPYDKAAVLACRIAWSHPLPDGNNRAGWASLVMFIDLNGGTWTPDPPDIDDAVDSMLRVAAREQDESSFAEWLRERVTFRN